MNSIEIRNEITSLKEDLFKIIKRLHEIGNNLPSIKTEDIEVFEEVKEYYTIHGTNLIVRSKEDKTREYLKKLTIIKVGDNIYRACFKGSYDDSKIVKSGDQIRFLVSKYE